MQKEIKIILSVFILIALFAGYNQLSSNNDIFAKSMALCCNNGVCHDMSCSSTSSILPCVGNEYLTTCTSCMYMVDELRDCDKYSGQWPTYCWKADGTKLWAKADI